MSALNLALGEEFLSAYSNLPKKQQRKVTELLRKLRQDPKSSGINYERIQGARDEGLHSVRVDQAYRGIVHKPDSGNTYILLWVDSHDAAYDWARRRQVAVNPFTGCIQVVDLELPEAQGSGADVENNSLRLFRKLKDKHLMQFGVPSEMIQLVKDIVTEAELETLSGRIPADAVECLQMYHAGIELDEILDDIACSPERKIDTGDFEAALKREGSKRFFHVVEGEDELNEILAAPLEKWRVFLHPSQRKLVERDWDGPVRVLGGAGTGKTVAAMHRARWLAMNRFTALDDKILFTTYTKNLAADIRKNLATITPPEVMARIEVVNLDEWVWEFLKANGYRFGFAFANQTREYWDASMALAPQGVDKAFIREEWNRVVQPFGIDTLEDYLGCDRKGRGTFLDLGQRRSIWPVFGEYKRLLEENLLREPADAMRDARRIITDNPGMLSYRSVIVDEAQDMGLQEFKLIRQLVQKKDNDSNSIFIVGDAHQRIYGKQVELGQAGIDTRNRTVNLRVNYRTTEENRNWAVELLKGLSFDDLDGGTDEQRGYTSLLHGELPEVQIFEHFDQEIDYLMKVLVSLLSQPGAISSVCITARVTSLVTQYGDELARRGIATCPVTKDGEDDRSRPGVRLATMHRVKGLEFDTMIVAGVNKGVVPLPAAIAGSDETTRAENEKGERALLYVAVTRARKKVIVTAVRPGSRLLSATKND